MTNEAPAQELIDRVRVILWEPQDPINIGSVVRVCRNTGVSDLRLVRPRSWNPDVVLISAPRSETFIATNVHRYDSFREAIEGTHRLYALTARGRRDRQRRLRVEDLLVELEQLLDTDATCAFVFGREDSGLPNSVVDRCDAYITLETSEDYPSMNLAQAVLLVLWNVFRSFGHVRELRAPQRTWEAASHDTLARKMDDVERALEVIDFFKGDQHENILRTLRSVFMRAGLDQQELATLWGVFREVVLHDQRRKS